MYTIARSALVAHRAEDMYSLVNDIESYSKFLPWCDASTVLSRADHEMVARVHIAYRGVRRSFTTRNRLTPFERIDLALVDGPFSALSGAWAFKELRADACRISLDLRFDFAAAAAARLIGPVFKRIADSLVDSFVARAAEVYGGGGAGDGDNKIRAEVVYALPERQVVECLEFDAPVTIEMAIRASNMLQQFPHIDLAAAAVGVFGVARPLDWVLEDRDRVEIYRPLLMSPTEARRERANQSRGGKGGRGGRGDLGSHGD
ncbi:MAG: RnfH family protein [Gammaproteobacteria bacterium]|nr:RnfH family protein [Gammaproteobacteria bacterium]